MNNRSKRFNPNKPPPSHHVIDEVSEISSLLRQCHSRNINYDENIVKIEGELTDISDAKIHNNEYLLDDSFMDEEYIPLDGSEHDTNSCLPKNTPKRSCRNMLNHWEVQKIVMLSEITRMAEIILL